MSDRSPNPKQASSESPQRRDIQDKHVDKTDHKHEARERLSAESQLHQKESSKTPKSPESESQNDRLKGAVKELHDAVHQKAWGGLGGPEPNVDKILNIIETLSPDSRKQLEKMYDQQYGKMSGNLRKDLTSAFNKNGSADLTYINKVLDRKPGVADVAGQLEWANACIKEGKNDKHAMEKVIIDAVSMCTKDELSNLPAGMETQLKANVSKETSQALTVLLNGKDKIYDDKGQMKDNFVHTLSDIALNSHPPRLDLYKLALQSASPEYRKTLRNQNTEKAIDKVFSGDDAKIAKDYLNKGRESTVTKVSGDHKEILGLQWWNNKDNITNAVESAHGTEESKLYAKGEQLANKYRLGEWLSQHGERQPKTKGEQEALKTFQSLQEKGNASPEDREAYKLYKDLKGELDKAGNPREVKLWEATLLGSEDIVSNLAKCHSEGMVPGMPGSHKAEDLYKAVENLSKKDFDQFRQHPEDLARVAQTLGTFASQEELNKVMSMLRQKINIKDKAWTYDKSKQVGTRGIAEVSEQNKANAFEEFFSHNTEKSVAKIDKLMNFTDAERRAYRDTNDPQHKQIEKQVTELVGSLKKGLEQDLANRLLDKVKNNKPVDAIDKVMLGELKGSDLKSTISALEKAYAESPATKDHKSLLDRLKNPQTAEDKKLKTTFETVLNNAVDRSGLGGHTHGKENYEPSHYPEFAKPLFETGYVPIDKKLELATNKQERLHILTNATKSEQASLLSTNPTVEAKALQNRVLGQGDERQFLQNVLQQSIQGKPMTAADECRAFVLGYGAKDSSELASKLKGLNDTDKQNLANEYYTKYGKEHGNQVADDVMKQVKESEKRSMREAFAEFPVTSKQTILNADANRAERREERWDATKTSADESVDQLLKFVREQKEDIDKLPKEKKAEFLKAVDEYKKAEKAYVESGGKESQALVDATVTALSLGAMVIPGGQTITAARLAAIAATNSAFRIAAKQCIQGKDFNGSAENILKEVFHGSTDAVLLYAGPEMVGMKLTGNAVKVALKTGIEEGSVIGAKFASGLDTALARQLDNVTCKDAMTGAKTVREKVEQAFRDNALKNTTEKEIQEATNAYMNRLKKETTIKVVANEAKEAGVNVGTGYVSSAGAQLATDIAFPPKEGLTPEQIIKNCLEAGQSGAAGGAIFHFGFKGLGAAYHGAKGTVGKVVDAAGKDKYFASNGTVIEHADGTREITRPDKRTWLKEGDKIVPPAKSPEAQRPSMEAQDKSQYMAETGELRRSIPDGYTDVGPNQHMNADGSISAARGATTYDAAHDTVLQQFKADAKTYINRFKQEHPNASKDEQMQELIRWEKRRLGEQTKSQEKQYTSFMSESGGKRVPVGELIDRGHLGCAERAHLLKLIADENIGKDYARVVRGDGTGAKASNHMWVETGDGNGTTIWDASRKQSKLSKETAGDKYIAESHLPGYGHGVRADQIRPGEPVRGSPGWKFEKTQPKNKDFVAVVHDAHMSVSTKDKQAFEKFKSANPELAQSGLEIGKTVKVPGPDGKLQDGYQIRHINKETGEIELVKPDGHRLTLPKEQLYKHLPTLKGGEKKSDIQTAIYESWGNLHEQLQLAEEFAGLPKDQSAHIDQILNVQSINSMIEAAEKLETYLKTNPSSDGQAILKDVESIIKRIRTKKEEINAAFQYKRTRTGDATERETLNSAERQVLETSANDVYNNDARTSEAFEILAAISIEHNSEIAVRNKVLVGADKAEVFMEQNAYSRKTQLSNLVDELESNSWHSPEDLAKAFPGHDGSPITKIRDKDGNEMGVFLFRVNGSPPIRVFASVQFDKTLNMANKKPARVFIHAVVKEQDNFRTKNPYSELCKEQFGATKRHQKLYNDLVATESEHSE